MSELFKIMGYADYMTNISPGQEGPSFLDIGIYIKVTELGIEKAGWRFVINKKYLTNA